MRSIGAALLMTAALVCSATTAWGAPVTIVHQGSLTSNGSPVNGQMDLRFTLFDAFTGGSVVAGPVTVSSLTVTDGLYTANVTVDDSSFDGTPKWFEIEAATAGTGSWFTLSPRQRVGTVPEAAHANRADEATIADYALSGPFAPTGPPSNSGLTPGSTTTVTLSVNGGEDPVQLHGSIRIELPYVADPSVGVRPTGQLLPYTVTVRRDFGGSYVANWRTQYHAGGASVRLEILTDQLDYGVTEWVFDSGAIVGYELVSGTFEGAYEQLTILFPGAQGGPFSATRAFHSAPSNNSPPQDPTLGRATSPAGGPPGGSLQVAWDGTQIDYEAVDTAVDIRSPFDPVNGNITGSELYFPVTFRRGVLTQNELFNDFLQSRVRPFEIEMFVGQSAQGRLLRSDGLIVELALSMAADGHPVEDYTIAVGNVDAWQP